MKIIIDVNVILSALIKDSMERKILIYSGLDFYFPKSSLDKINKYREDGLILEKLFTDESAEDIAFDISCQLFGRGI